MADLTPEQQQALDAFDEAADKLENLGVQVDRFGSKSLKSIDDRFKDLDKTVKRSGGSYKDVISQLNDLADAIEDNVTELNTTEKKQEARNKLNEIAEKARQEKLTSFAVETLGTAVKTFANYYINQVKIGMRGVMSSNTSAFQMAADLQVQGAQDINAGVQTAATAAEATGAALMLIPHPASIAAGALLTFGGALTGFISSKSTEYFTEKTRILASAVESAYNSFMQASQAGAIFGGGLTDLRNVALQSGLDQEKFSKVIMDNREMLAEAGFGITDSIRMVSNISKRFVTDFGKSGQTLRREMQNLGFSIEEQVALAAEVGATMKRFNAKALDTDMAQATAEYAKNLRLIAEVTGEDAKKRMDEAKKVTDEYSFQRKFLREHNGDINALMRARAAIAKLDVTEQRAIHQMYLRGTTNVVPAILGGFRDTASQMASIMHEQNFRVEDLDSTYAKFHDTLLTENSTRKEAIASTGQFNDANKETADYLSRSWNQALKNNTESLNRSRNEIDKGLDPHDEFTAKVNESVDALQTLRNTVQKDLTEAIKKFASEVPGIIRDFRSKLYTIGLLERPEAPKTYEAGPVDQTYFMKGPTESQSEYAERMRKYAESYNASAAKERSGYAKGGIAEGPLSGYKELLHGTEAVVPLPDGETIPVTIKQEAPSISERSIQTLIDEVKAGNMASETNFRDLIKAMKENVNYTARVAINTN